MQVDNEAQGQRIEKRLGKLFSLRVDKLDYITLNLADAKK